MPYKYMLLMMLNNSIYISCSYIRTFKFWNAFSLICEIYVCVFHVCSFWSMWMSKTSKLIFYKLQNISYFMCVHSEVCEWVKLVN